MNFNVITLFPELIHQSCAYGLVGQAIENKKVGLNTINPREFTLDIHHAVDDRPFGGGDGMILKCEPLEKAIHKLGKNAGHRVLLSAQGTKWSDKIARKWAKEIKTPITLVCGRYGGVDQRFINSFIDEEISIGDYILSGGEMAALVLIDSVVRLLPEVLGNPKSIENESFADGLLEAPQFTRPQDYSGLRVPQVFLSGDHDKIERAKAALSFLVTLEKRPELISQAQSQNQLTDVSAEIARSVKALSAFTDDELYMCGLKNLSILKEHRGAK